MIQKLLSWIRHFFKKRKSLRHAKQKVKEFSHVYVEDVPYKLKPGIIYIIGTDECYWQLMMECPCGCKVALYINLLNDYSPNWSFQFDDQQRLSISPSIHRKVDCMSHFFIRQGRVVWA